MKCDSPCSGRKWGPNCELDCTCQNSGSCDPNDGSCECPAGYIGSLCNASKLFSHCFRQVIASCIYLLQHVLLASLVSTANTLALAAHPAVSVIHLMAHACVILAIEDMTVMTFVLLGLGVLAVNRCAPVSMESAIQRLDCVSVTEDGLGVTVISSVHVEDTELDVPVCNSIGTDASLNALDTLYWRDASLNTFRLCTLKGCISQYINTIVLERCISQYTRLAGYATYLLSFPATCQCASSASCNPVDGSCTCAPGMQGKFCNHSK